MHLRNLGILGLLFLLTTGKCIAQVRGDDYHGHGYAYVAPGGFTAAGNTLSAIGLGAGGEAMLYKALLPVPKSDGRDRRTASEMAWAWLPSTAPITS